MKIRTDFVTNSSSSSFIFGEPCGNTVKVEDIIKLIRDAAKKVWKIMNYIDIIVLADKQLAKWLKEVTANEASYTTEQDFYSTMISRSDIQSIIDSQLRSEDIQDVLDIESFVHDYIHFEARYILQRIVESTNSSLPITSVILDLKTYEANKFATEVIDWYTDEKDWDKLYNYYKEHNDTLYKYFGEVGVFGWHGDIPISVVKIIEDKAKYACDHMG